MLDITKNSQSLTSFRRHSSDFMRQLKENKRPVVLTVNGKATAFIQDAEAYQHLLDIVAQADAEEGVCQGLDDVRTGRVRDAAKVFAEIECKQGISGWHAEQAAMRRAAKWPEKLPK